MHGVLDCLFCSLVDADDRAINAQEALAPILVPPLVSMHAGFAAGQQLLMLSCCCCADWSSIL